MKIFTLFILFLSLTLEAKELNITLGEVNSEVITQRDIQISYCIEIALLDKRYDSMINDIKTDFFKRYLSKYVLEFMIYLDAKEFGFKPKKNNKKAYFELQKRLNSLSLWQQLKVNPTEFSSSLERRNIVNQFVSFKEKVSDLAVSDEEAENYFQVNNSKFGSMPFEKFKKSIKVYLKNTYAQKQIRDWYEALKEKYKVILSL